MQVKINKIDLWSTSKVFACLQACVGLVTGIFFTISYAIDPESVATSAGGIASAFGIWSFIVLPVLNGLLGLLSGVLVAGIYNFGSQILGGIKIDIENT